MERLCKKYVIIICLLLLFLLFLAIILNIFDKKKDNNTSVTLGLSNEAITNNVLSQYKSEEHTIDVKKDDEINISLKQKDEYQSYVIYLITEKISEDNNDIHPLNRSDNFNQSPYQFFLFKEKSSSITIKLDAGTYSIFCIGQDTSSNFCKIEISITVDRLLDGNDNGTKNYLIPCE